MRQGFRVALAAGAMTAIVLFVPGAAPGQGRGGGRSSPARGAVFVKFKADATASERSGVHGRAGGSPKFRSRLTRWEALEIPEGSTPEEMLAVYRSDPSVEVVEFASPRHLARIPNDLKKEQYGLHNTGQQIELCSAPRGGARHVCGRNESGTVYNCKNDADIDAPEAWDLVTGSRKIIVAVNDSGVDLTRGDLSTRLLPGYDFVHDDASPDDDHGHGTAVASVIGAIGNNDKAMTGVNWNVSILPIKVCASDGSCDPVSLAQGIEFAISHGANVINMSYACLEGPSDPNCTFMQSEYDLFTAAQDAGVVLVPAAGNSFAVIDQASTAYPCGYDHEGSICAGATDMHDLVAPFSNRGPGVVDIGAPGVEMMVLNPTPPGGLTFYNGTSFAAPMTSGVAALMLARTPLTPAAVRDRIVRGGDAAGNLTDFFEGGRLNAYNAVRDVLTPGKPYLNGGLADVDLIADVNGDGRGDLVRGTVGKGFEVNLASRKKPRFTKTQRWSSVSPGSVVLAGRLDGNAREDLVVGDANGFVVLRAKKQKNGFRAPEVWSNVPAGATQVLGDVNGDGLDDLVLADTGLDVMLSNGSSFEAPDNWSSTTGATYNALGDFNGDGLEDFATWANGASNTDVMVLLSTGSGFGIPIRWYNGAKMEMVGAGDFDGDGLEDLLGYGISSGCLEVLSSTSTRFEKPRAYTCRSDFDELLAGRVGKNRDPRADVLMHEPGGLFRLLESRR